MNYMRVAFLSFLSLIVLFACKKDETVEDEQSTVNLINTILDESIEKGVIDNNYIYVFNDVIVEQQNADSRLSKLKTSNLISIEVYEKSKAIEDFGDNAEGGAVVIDYYSNELILPEYYNSKFDLCDCDPAEYLCRCPLVVLDGVILKGDQITPRMNSLQSYQIESITVLKGEAAIELYGDLGINGVLLITTK